MNSFVMRMVRSFLWAWTWPFLCICPRHSTSRTCPCWLCFRFFPSSLHQISIMKMRCKEIHTWRGRGLGFVLIVERCAVSISTFAFVPHIHSYIIAKRDASPGARVLLFERALSVIPGSYKIWLAYLQDRMRLCRAKCILDPLYHATNVLFERALITMHKVSSYFHFLLLLMCFMSRCRVFGSSTWPFWPSNTWSLRLVVCMTELWGFDIARLSFHSHMP